MKISIVIVNYNVKYFLDQCISSIYKSEGDFDIEIIVVDNDSSDNSVQHIEQKFPKVIVEQNVENVGFSKANNQGVRKASGEFILVLNPDTLMSADTLKKCLGFYQQQSKQISNPIGIIGVKMYDGSGLFLQESKRGFPTPFVSFSKIFGLGKLFPTSKLLNRYYLGHLDADETHAVPILTGAFMFMKKNVFLDVNGFDEDYFMYGEDIDISYRVEQAGYENYYLSTTKIIHYKGESTRKLSFDYLKRFYEAMIIFAKKHLSGTQVFAYSFAITAAIYLNAILSFLLSFIKRIRIPVRDAIISAIIFIGTAAVWERLYFNDTEYFSNLFTFRNVPIYISILLFIYLLGGKYHRRFHSWQWIKILSFGILALVVCYGLLPDHFRFSRAVLVIGSILAAIDIFYVDYFGAKPKHAPHVKTRTAIVGAEQHSDSLLALLDKRGNTELIGFINDELQKNSSLLGSLNSVESIVRFHLIDELIFDQQRVATADMMRVMTNLDHDCQYKIYTAQSETVVGSYSKELQGQIETFNIEYAITTPYSKFIKRFIDVLFSILAILGAPILWILNKFSSNYWKNIISVLTNRKTWIGYIRPTSDIHPLPNIKSGVISHQQFLEQLSSKQHTHLNYIYAREYSPWIDIRSFFSQLNQLHK